jgi:hypothetical protein
MTCLRRRLGLELHPDDYDDPEEDDWVLPLQPDPALLPDNTSSWGPLYFWRGCPNPKQLLVSIAVTREISPPWRRGLGIVVRNWKATKGVAIGLWVAGPPPSILKTEPREENLQRVLERANALDYASKKRLGG